MTSRPSTTALLDSLALVECYWRQDHEGISAILAAVDLHEISRCLAWILAAQLPLDHGGTDQAWRMLAASRTVLLDQEAGA